MSSIWTVMPRKTKKIKQTDEIKNMSYELFIAALSILSVSNLLLLIFFRSEIVDNVIYITNFLLSAIFMADFIYRVSVTHPKSKYIIGGYGWADFLASLPFAQLKILRLFRLFRASRIMAKFGTRRLIHKFISNRGTSALLTLFFLAICVLEFGGIAIILAEKGAENANIKNASDALWWIFATITTVGYGDRFPVTNQGRIVGVIVMIVGIGLFGTLTGYLANAFLEPKKK